MLQFIEQSLGVQGGQIQSDEFCGYAGNVENQEKGHTGHGQCDGFAGRRTKSLGDSPSSP